MKSKILVLIVGSLIGLQANANRLHCQTHSYTGAEPDGSINLRYSSDGRGEVTLYGDKLTDYFQQELQILNADCYNTGGPGISIRNCVITADVDLVKGSFVATNNNSAIIQGVVERHGFKMINSDDAQKNWYFNTCSR